MRKYLSLLVVVFVLILALALSACDVIQRKFGSSPACDAELSKYANHYGYESLTFVWNGLNMQKFYNQLEMVASEFHDNYDLNLKYEYIVASIDYTDFNITDEQAIAAWQVFKNDHPLYYWMSKSATIAGRHFILLSESEYANGSDRETYNTLIYKSIEEYLSDVDTTSAYKIALAAHDKIIYAIDYAYERDGKTPQDAIWAHNVLGVFEKGSGVCESYARTFQLILNYCDIENVFVVGTTGDEDHAWNLAKMDDGNWYWFDLTFDDDPDWMWGIKHDYFCINDFQNTVNCDFDWKPFERNFLYDHNINSSIKGVYIGEIPDRSPSEYEGSEMLLRDTFTVDELEYAWVGHNMVQLIGIHKDGEIIIPDTIEYNEHLYEVVSIGMMTEEGVFSSRLDCRDSQGLECKITSISIPESVKFITDSAFSSIATLEYIYVDPKNEHFTSDDKGVLYSKERYVLIQFPSNSPLEEYTLPDETRYLAIESLEYYRRNEVSNERNLKTLNIGANLTSLSDAFCNWGTGYDIIYTYINMLIGSTGAESIDIVNISPDNTSLFIVNGLVCCKRINSTMPSIDIECCPRSVASLIIPDFITEISDGRFERCSNLISVAIPNSVTKIGRNAFCFCTSLEEINIPSSIVNIADWTFAECQSLVNIIIPNSVTKIGEYAFYNCESLTSITFEGTIEQWYDIAKGTNWHTYVPATEVVCSDGTVSLE